MRRLWRSFVLFLAILSLSSSVVWAAENMVIVRWSDVEQAINEHPSFRISKEEMAVAQREVRLARQYPNPDFGVRLGAADPKGQAAKEFVWDLELTIPLEWPGTYIERGKAATQGVEAAKSESHMARLEVWRQLRSLYLTIAFDQEKLRLLYETGAQFERLREAVKIRVEKGEARPVELLRAQSEAEEQAIATHAAQVEAAAHRAQLALWLGARLPPDFAVVFDAEPETALPSLAEATKQALDRNPAISAAKARQKQASFAASAERHAAVPNLAMGAFYGRDLDSATYGGALSIGLPLWNWNLGGIAKADAEKRRASAQADAKEREVKDAVIAAHAKAQAAYYALVRYRESVLPAAAKAFQDTEQLYLRGETGLTDLLDARRAYLRSQEAYKTQQLNYRLAMLDLSVWMGEAKNG